jgi:uncharacterized pyridoxamine 5'-phosphate oxidase family protein
MGFVMRHEDKIWLGMGDYKNVYKQIVANPKVEVAATNKEGGWLRITGELTFDPRPELFDLAAEAMPMLKEIYPAGGPNKMAVGWLKGEARFNDMAGNTTKIVAI